MLFESIMGMKDQFTKIEGELFVDSHIKFLIQIFPGKYLCYTLRSK